MFYNQSQFINPDISNLNKIRDNLVVTERKLNSLNQLSQRHK